MRTMPASAAPANPYAVAKVRLWQIAPWFVCAAAFAYLFRQVPPKDVLGLVRHTDVSYLVFWSFAYFLFVLLADVFATRHFINRFVTPATFREITLVRGVTYLMMILNYTAAQGAIAVYLRKTHKASVAKSLGTMAFVSIADFLIMFTSALIALSFTPITYAGINFRSIAVRTVPALYAGFVLWVVFWRNVNRPAFDRWRRYRLVGRLLDHNLFGIFREAGFKDYALLFLMRLPLIVAMLGALHYALGSLRADVAWSWLFLYNPIITFIGAMPITPGGFGTTQILAIEFYGRLVASPLIAEGLARPENLIFAASIVWGLVNQAYKAVFGLVCLGFSSREFFRE